MPNRTTVARAVRAPPGRWLTRLERGWTEAEGPGQIQRLRTDARGDLVAIERRDDAGLWSTFATFTSDSDGNRLTAADALGQTTRFVYDGKEQLVSVTDPAVETTTFGYDARGNRTRVVDAKNRPTRFGYDDLSRLREVVQEAESLTTAFRYDAAGNVTQVVDPKDQTTLYAYDALSRLTAVTQPLGQTVSYGYDPRGRLSTVTNARAQVLRYGYEPWGGLAQIEHFADAAAAAIPSPFRTVAHGYDLSGNIETTSDTDIQAGPLYTFVADALDRVEASD